MRHTAPKDAADLDAIETREWLDSLDYVLQSGGPVKVQRLLRELTLHATENGVKIPFTANTPYINTISADDQALMPGSPDLERRIKSLVRWNAAAMVVRANKAEEGIGGHISTFASAATLYEVGFNHFFRGHESPDARRHLLPGSCRARHLRSRLPRRAHRRDATREFPSRDAAGRRPVVVSASVADAGLLGIPDGLDGPRPDHGDLPGALHALPRRSRAEAERSNAKVWAFLGDGETDEPEALGAITLPAREKLDNLIFVINCNLQRLDGPVRGNGQIIQELEAAFRGAGWNVIKAIWGREWDPLLAKDRDGLLVKRMGEIVDGQYQKYAVESGAYVREHFWGADPRLLDMVKHLSDDQLKKMTLGGHDPIKVYNAYKAAVEHKGAPTVVLARTIKGYGLGEAGEGKNITHQQKKMNEDELRAFRTRFGIPVSDAEISKTPFYRPSEDSIEIKYMRERREALGGFVPSRQDPQQAARQRCRQSSSRSSTTAPKAARRRRRWCSCGCCRRCCATRNSGSLVVPIVPDEARTFGMEALFRQVGIYSHAGQVYEPVDMDTLLYYKEASDGQILEEGINEAGSMSSFIAAGTAYATHGVNTIPFFIFYSMFGFQRIGDLIWAAGDSRTRGFLLGGTAGRTTLAGEGLQHQDGNSQLLAYPVPNIVAYDPAFAYEIAVIIKDGIRRMYVDQESIFYYLTVMNEQYAMPHMPEGAHDGILKGLYRFSATSRPEAPARAQLFGSGAILPEVIKAAEILESKYNVGVDVWSVTSYSELYRDGHACERWNMLHPTENPRVPYVSQCLHDAPGVFVAASDYVKALPDSIDRWLPRPLTALGTDGFGRSESRASLREFFEVDYRYIVVATLATLDARWQDCACGGRAGDEDAQHQPDKSNPAIS